MVDKKKTKKSSWQTVEEYQSDKFKDLAGATISESEIDRLSKISKDRKDSYMSRNEFKPGFYDQKDKPPITAETMYGKGTTRTLEYPTVDPDTSMMMNRKKGGMTKGQKKVSKVMKEFKAGKLHSGKKGPVVKNPKQAIAIALSEAGMSKPKKMAGGGDAQGPFLQGVTPEIERSAEGAEGSQARIERDKAKITAHTKVGNIGIGRTESKIYQGAGTPELKQREDKVTYDKNFRVNDSTDVLLYGERGVSKSEYSGYGDSKKSQGTFRVGAKATMKFEKGGAVEIGKGKDYIKDLL